ncbi:hypothetical protein PLESTM_000353500 [Pleodorina starrii]|nr:hypothetical protein PLESTM_000353500 [Pleodorina starrii]
MKAKERGPPTFKGKDAETYMFRLKVWLTQNSEANPFAAMLSGFEDNEEAKTWAQNEHDEDPNIMERSIEDLEKRFMFRFAPKWDYYKKNALCVRCGEKGHRGEDCKKFPSAKAKVVERMEADQ